MPDEHVHPIPQQDYFLQHIHDCFVYSGFNVSNYGDSAVSFESVFRSLMPLIPWKLSLLCVSVSYFHPIIQICILFSPLFPPSASSVLPPFKESWAATWAIPCCCLASWASTLVIPPYNWFSPGSLLFLLFFYECLLLLTFFCYIGQILTPHFHKQREAILFIHRHDPVAFTMVSRRHVYNFRCFMSR